MYGINTRNALRGVAGKLARPDERKIAHMGKENEMEIKQNGNELVVSGYGHTYSVPVDTPATNCFGNETGYTVGEEFGKDNLYVYDDYKMGNSHGMHGALVAGKRP